MVEPFLILVGAPVQGWVQQLRYAWQECPYGYGGFLQYIVDNYQALPMNLIYVQPEDRALTHHGSLLELFNNPGFEAMYYKYDLCGCFPLNSYKLSSLQTLDIPALDRWWQTSMQSYFGPRTGYRDYSLQKMSSGQLIVSRERILGLPREFYFHLLADLRAHFSPVSLFLEYSWELIFTSYQHRRRREINGQMIVALYGLGSYQRDITPAFLRKTWIEGGLYLPAQLNLNEIGGDPLVGQGKVLTIYIDDQMFQLPEVRQTDFRHPLRSIHSSP